MLQSPKPNKFNLGVGQWRARRLLGPAIGRFDQPREAAEPAEARRLRDDFCPAALLSCSAASLPTDHSLWVASSCI